MSQRCLLVIGELADRTTTVISLPTLQRLIETLCLECESIEKQIAASGSIHTKAGLMGDYQSVATCLTKLQSLSDTLERL